MVNFDLSTQGRDELIDTVASRMNFYYDNTRSFDINTQQSQEELQTKVADLIKNRKSNPVEAFDSLMAEMERGNLHNSHPKYMGLFTPRVPYILAVSEFIKAVYNPNLGSWGHAPFPVEVEVYLIQQLGKKFGYPSNSIDGVFTTGGAEGNLNGVLCALKNRYPEIDQQGLQKIEKKPTLYCSVEAHHSILKAARIVGLGQMSVRLIPTDQSQRIDLEKLRFRIINDQADGFDPFMIISIVGTTGSGAIDPIAELNSIAREFNMWHHVDAAYGGAIVFHDSLRPLLAGIEWSNSISVDLHKWPASPVGTNVFLTSDKKILHDIFSIDAGYMPTEVHSRINPYAHSMQWSRRFIGLSFYMMLMVYGWEGYAELIQRQLKIGEYLKSSLTKRGWEILNNSQLPLICFSHSLLRNDALKTQRVCDKIINSGNAWISTYNINGVKALRACITNYETRESDVDMFVDSLNAYIN